MVPLFFHVFFIVKSNPRPPYARLVMLLSVVSTCFFRCGLLFYLQKIPEHAAYRKDVEAISNYRLRVAEENQDVSCFCLISPVISVPGSQSITLPPTLTPVLSWVVLVC